MFVFNLKRAIIFWVLFCLLLSINDYLYWKNELYLLSFFQKVFNPLTPIQYLYNSIILGDTGLFLAWIEIFSLSFLVSFLDYRKIFKIFKSSKIKSSRVKNKRRSRRNVELLFYFI